MAMILKRIATRKNAGCDFIFSKYWFLSCDIGD